jgi:MoaA/NifB/PqqE/SkfB family radical SAM enzyme
MQPDGQRLRLYSERPQDHDLHPGRAIRYEELIEQVHRAERAGELDSLRLEIPVTRYNFLDLIPVANHALELKRIRCRLRWPCPRRPDREDLAARFGQCLDELNHQLHGHIRLVPRDPLVDELLRRIQAAYGAGHPEVLRRLRRCHHLRLQFGDHLRLLGAMLDDTFTGPSVVVLSLFNRCNLNCAHCWIHHPTVRGADYEKKLKLNLELEEVKAIVDDGVKMGVSNFTLLGEGEVMLHPDFEAIVGHIRTSSPGAHVVVFTNGVALDRSKAELLVEQGVDSLSCSVPAVTAETWARVCPDRPVALLGRLRENLTALNELKRQAQGSRPSLTINFVLSRLNYAEAEWMARFAALVGAEACHFQVVQGVKELAQIALEREMVHELLRVYPRIEAIADEAGMALPGAFRDQIERLRGLGPGASPRLTNWSQSIFTRRGCYIGWGLVVVKASGDVSFCCGMKVVDSIRERSLREIWFSPEYRRYRVAAKNLLANRDLTFRRSIYKIDNHLYNHRCEKCNNIEPNTYYARLINEAGLRPFVPGLPY